MAVRGSETIGGSFGGAGESGADGGGNGAPPTDLAKGKSVVVEEQVSIEILTGPVEFHPVVGASGHRPITKDDFAEVVNDATLDHLFQENLAIVAVVVAAR